jgi:NADPH:quinone reductase-like Zn-dependent oxidoreductase
MVRVSRSSVIDAPVDALWRLLRDFNSHAAWHPAIAESHMEAGESGDLVGSVRAFHLADGSALREQLIALSDRDRELTYCLIEAPVPLVDYVATLRLRPVTEGDRTFIHWESRFRPPEDQAAALTRLVGEGIYEAGFAALKARFGMPAARSGSRAERPAQAAVEIAPPRSAGPVSAPAERGGFMESRAIVVERYGGPDVMHPATIRVPPPGPGEVRLRHGAIGVNFIDVYCRTGFFNLLKPPGVPGMEGAGTVIDAGPGVTRLRPGDRVVYACEPVGAYATVRTMPAALLVPLPPDIDDTTAAAIFLKGISVEFLIHSVYPVRRGDVVLLHAAAGGMGLLLCQWATALGAHVIGTVSSDEKAERVLAAGAERAVVYSREDFVAAVMDFTGGRGADVVYDGVGGDTFGRSLEAVAIRGHVVSFGQASGPVGTWDVGAMASRSVTVSRPNFGHYTSDPAELNAMADRLFDAVRRGIIVPTIDRRVPLEQAVEAHRRLENRENVGAMVLIP